MYATFAVWFLHHTHTHTHTDTDTDTHARTHTHTGHILAVMQVITLFRFKIQSSQIDLFGIGLLTGQVLLLETERRVSIHRKIGPSPLSVSVSVSSVKCACVLLNRSVSVCYKVGVQPLNISEDRNQGKIVPQC